METDHDTRVAPPVAPPLAERPSQSFSQPPDLQRAKVRPAPEFPGCRQIRISREDVGTYDGRFEYWEAETETAWVVREPTGLAHEEPSQRLAGLCAMISAVRGSAIRCCGSTNLELRNRHGERHRIMQADQVVYLHPWRARLPMDGGLIVGEHDFSDVVLEVDHTTDVRRGKLWLYEEWGFPEVWVEVPEQDSPSRARSRRAGLTIHRLAGGRYREARESRAFPGWTAEEIHAAMNEPELSEATSEIIDRVGRRLGAREGTSPDDMPWLRRHRAEGEARGHAEGRAEGEAKGRARALEEAARAVLASRKLAAPFRLDAAEWAGVSSGAIMNALLECEDEADFHARLRALRRNPAATAGRRH